VADLLGHTTCSRADRLEIGGGGGCEEWRKDLELGLAGHEICRGRVACWPDVIFSDNEVNHRHAVTNITPSIPEYRALIHFEINFDLYFWSRKYKIYDIIIIPLDSYSKELCNGIIFISNISFFGLKLMIKVCLKIHNFPIIWYGGSIF
jgi:hypothetical protein